MQQRVERWLSYWVAKPTSWAIFGVWLAVKYCWIVAILCINRLRDNWAQRQGANKPVVLAELPIVAPSKRAGGREVIRKE
jgi:hypothetical protein